VPRTEEGRNRYTRYYFRINNCQHNNELHKPVGEISFSKLLRNNPSIAEDRA
jgi:hypothetical protein